MVMDWVFFGFFTMNSEQIIYIIIPIPEKAFFTEPLAIFAMQLQKKKGTSQRVGRDVYITSQAVVEIKLDI